LEICTERKTHTHTHTHREREKGKVKFANAFTQRVFKQWEEIFRERERGIDWQRKRESVCVRV